MNRGALKTVFTLLVGCLVAAQSYGVQILDEGGAGWSESIVVTYNRQADTHVGNPVFRGPPHDGIAPVGSWGHSGNETAENVNRAVHIFNRPHLYNNDPAYEGFFVLSATMYISLEYGWCNWNGYGDMPGVKAYYIDMAAPNTSLSDAIDPNDFWSPILLDLGFVVPAGGTLDAGGLLEFEGSSAQGEYAVDVTAALRDAVESGLSYLPIRLQLGGENDGKTIDANINIDYVFKHAAYGGPPLGPPRLEVILTDLPEDCAQVHDLGFGYSADANQDCRIDLQDLALMAAQWTLCNDPDLVGTDPACQPNW